MVVHGGFVELPLVERGDACARQLHRCREIGRLVGELRQGGLAGLGRHADRAGVAVELLRQLSERGVASFANVGQDLSDDITRRRVVVEWAWECACRVVDTAEIEAAEHGRHGTGAAGGACELIQGSPARQLLVSLRAELGSVSSSLEGLLDRLDELVAEASPGDDGEGDALALALLDVERSLRSGARRLERIITDLD